MSRDWREKLRDVLEDKYERDSDFHVGGGDVVIIDGHPYLVVVVNPPYGETFTALASLENGNGWWSGVEENYLNTRGSLRALVGDDYDEYTVEVYS